MPGTSAGRSATASVSAGIAAANVHPSRPREPEARFPVENGLSLAALAQNDLDAALQLLAERAQYITDASGAAIALRRGEHNDMLCRASAGSNAPELGALLSMEYGFSGESVRTRQTLRCDDAEQDSRVNREVCRQLGIASVVVMPIVAEEQVLGVFELLSGKAHAFAERDISTLQRLSEMVETAVRHAVAAQALPVAQALPAPETTQSQADETPPVEAREPSPAPASLLNSAAPADDVLSLQESEVEAEKPKLEKTDLKPEPGPPSKKPVFWSAATQAPAASPTQSESAAVPPVLRNLQKCEACGFPVSQGRKLCVECEEKQWRGQRLPATGAVQQARPPAEAPGSQPREAVGTSASKDSSAKRLVDQNVSASGPAVAAGPSVITPGITPGDLKSARMEPALGADTTSPGSSPDTATNSPRKENEKVHVSGAENAVPLFGSAAAEPESWFAAHKYIVGALLVVAAAVAALVLLR